MKRTMVQLLLVLALMLVAGTAYNLVNSRDPNKYLAWYTTKFGWGIAPPPKRVPVIATPAAPPAVMPATPPATSPPVQEASKQQSQVPEKEPQPAPVAKELPQHPDDPNLRTVGLKEAVEEYKSGTLFIDARRSKDYEAGHITGAISISPYEADMEEKIGRLKENPETIAEAPIVAYCTNANDCEDSKFLSQQLKAAGFPNVMVYTGGFYDWQKEHPDHVTKGKEPGKREP